MRERSSFFVFAVVAAIGAAAAPMQGCYKDDALSLYGKYAEGSHLVTCRGMCMTGSAPIAGIVKKDDCDGKNSEWLADEVIPMRIG